MDVGERLASHWFGLALWVGAVVGSASVVATYSILHAVQVEPLQHEVGRLERSVTELERNLFEARETLNFQKKQLDHLRGASVHPGSTEINTDPRDFDTLRVYDYADDPPADSSRWKRSVAVTPGHKVALGIYYHVSGANPAEDLRVSLRPLTSGKSTCHAFEATVSARNSRPAIGTAWVVSSKPVELAPVADTILWRPQQYRGDSRSFLFEQTGQELLAPHGLRLGDIDRGWSAQGSVLVGMIAKDS